MIAYRQNGDRFIPAQHQPALVLDYACSHDLHHEGKQLLGGSGLQGWDMPAADTLLTPQEYLQLLANIMRALDSADSSFMLGQQMLPGHYGALSHALLQGQNLRQALEILCAGHARLCPLLTPRLREEGGLAVLYWTDSFGAPSQLPALVEMHMTAVTAMCRWLSGERLPWRYCINRSAPAHVEQHEVHLGSDLRFNCHLDAMLIDPQWLDRPWPRGNAMAASVAMQGMASEASALTPSLLTALYDYLLENIRMGPTLEGSAAAFGTSPATLKRHLARHGSHFQAELDRVRAHVAMQLFQMRGYDNEAVAQYLGFHDATNFRRSFKRWTGLVPSLLRDALAPR
ncbi:MULTISPECIES: AraC family transcriptional regulator [unclassified Duganella]|uniref:AraC family transcriptional regulator n=1 Tax=unclassified Duganella TaxID=2636909 RepID=UPI00088DDDCA|nr:MULTISPECIES: AraC family transcriptional regulator [unclassified Duganella]SDG84013.1 AraC-type DNA-binding protein [Duganella sp. OV458]SDK11465.1 transcriptional regulator, AraC family [Duganella sp. OV510]